MKFKMVFKVTARYEGNNSYSREVVAVDDMEARKKVVDFLNAGFKGKLPELFFCTIEHLATLPEELA